MKKLKLSHLAISSLLASGIFLLAGCSDNQVSYGGSCMTCLDNPITGAPMNYDPAKYSNKVQSGGASSSTGMSTMSAPQTIAKDSITLSFGRDVDTTAMRIKESFGFMSREEAIAEMGPSGKMMFAGPGYAYRADPGSMYIMKTQAYSGDLTATVTKQGSGTQVVMKYAQKHTGGAPISTVMTDIRNKAQRAVQ